MALVAVAAVAAVTAMIVAPMFSVNHGSSEPTTCNLEFIWYNFAAESVGKQVTWELWAGPLYHLFVLVNHGGAPGALADAVDRAGMSYHVGIDLEQLDERGAQAPDAVLLDMASLEEPDARRFVELCHDRRLPVLAAVPREAVSGYDPSINADEMVVCPVSEGELTTRVKQAMYRVSGPAGPQLLRVGDLAIDLERYEVTVAGRRVALTYKEFQLLVLLASNPGRVYTRDALLSQIWGYDYLGGTRTVDVHIRRLRSKVESPGRSFVETIWNVGYRFKSPD